jgi:hypothetical protein
VSAYKRLKQTRSQVTQQTKNSSPSHLLLPFGRIVHFEVFTETNPSYKMTQPLAEEISLRVADQVQPSIMQRRFIESSTQDFSIISEVAEAYDENSKYQLLLVQLRRKFRVLSGEYTPRKNLKFVYKYKTSSWVNSLPLDINTKTKDLRDLQDIQDIQDQN